MAFVVIKNPASDQTASDVVVEVRDISASDGVLNHRTGTISSIGPGQREAVAIAFPLGRTLPADFKANVSSVRWAGAGAPPLAQVIATTFLQDARTPSVQFRVSTQGGAAVRFILTAVCLDAAGNVRGGGTGSLALGSNSGEKMTVIPIELSAIPNSCDGFGFVAS